MFITTACFFSLQNTQVHKSYENKTVFIHTAHTTATHLVFVHYDCICLHMIFPFLISYLFDMLCRNYFIWGIIIIWYYFVNCFCYRRFLGFVIGFDYSWFFLEQLRVIFQRIFFRNLADHAAWNTNCKWICRNISGNDASSTDHTALADRNTTTDCNISCDPAVIANGNRSGVFLIGICSILILI